MWNFLFGYTLGRTDSNAKNDVSGGGCLFIVLAGIFISLVSFMAKFFEYCIQHPTNFMTKLLYPFFVVGLKYADKGNAGLSIKIIAITFGILAISYLLQCVLKSNMIVFFILKIISMYGYSLIIVQIFWGAGSYTLESKGNPDDLKHALIFFIGGIISIFLLRTLKGILYYRVSRTIKIV